MKYLRVTGYSVKHTTSQKLCPEQPLKRIPLHLRVPKHAWLCSFTGPKTVIPRQQKVSPRLIAQEKVAGSTLFCLPVAPTHLRVDLTRHSTLTRLRKLLPTSLQPEAHSRPASSWHSGESTPCLAKAPGNHEEYHFFRCLQYWGCCYYY